MNDSRRPRKALARAAVVLAAGALLAQACVRNPATGKKQLNLVSDEQAAQLGRQGAAEVVQSVGLYPDKALQDYVQQVGQRIAARSDRPDLPWQFAVLDDPSVNAFALPGGYIFVTRGMLAYMGSEAELAGVLGHEIGHVTARHSANQISKQQLGQLGLVLGAVIEPDLAKFAGLANVGLQLLSLKYSRDHETQADELGFRYALASGYDARSMTDLFETLDRTSEGRGGLPGWLQTHPAPQDRVERTRQRIAQADAQWAGLERGREQYLARIDGLLFGDNPEGGYFEDNAFYSPARRFGVAFPAGWELREMRNAVVAASPRGDALVLVGDIGAGAPARAAQLFASQPGTRTSRLSEGQVNGLPAAALYFQAQAGERPVEGFSSFVVHGGRTYQILGFTSQGKLEQYEAPLRASLDSFRALNEDSGKLAVRAARLDVAKVEQPATLGQFNEKNPSVIPLPRLAVLNGVEPDAVLPQGALVKRVVIGG